MSDDFVTDLIGARRVSRSQQISGKKSDARQRDMIAAGLPGIGPKDALEEMVAAQMLAVHAAAMECFRLALGEE